jgi:hypothetical protein
MLDRPKPAIVAMIFCLGLLGIWSGAASAAPPKIDWKTFVEQLEQDGGTTSIEVGEEMC